LWVAWSMLRQFLIGLVGGKLRPCEGRSTRRRLYGSRPRWRVRVTVTAAVGGAIRAAR